MRQLLLLLTLVFSGSLAAQVSATFELPHLSVNNGGTVCLPITVENFTGGIEFSFALRVDPGGALTFNRVQNLSPMVNNFGMEDFNTVDFLGEGIITVLWQNFDENEGCQSAPGVVTLDDGTVLFEVCYDVNGASSSNHPVDFFDKPDSVPFDGVDDSLPIVFNKRAQCDQTNDAFPETLNGSITIDIPPVLLEVEERTGNFQPGDIFCTDVIVVDGFDDLAGYQFGLVFDSTVLRSRVANENPDLDINGPFNFSFFGGSSFYAIWSPVTTEVFSLEDGERLFTVCFDVVGDCGDGTSISLGALPDNADRPAEASSNDEFIEIPVIGNTIQFDIDNCNPDGFDVNIGCPDMNPTFGDTEFCIEVQAGRDFERMEDIDYTISWDPAILSFTGVGDRAPGLGISPTMDFITDQTDQGVIFFDWDSPLPSGNSLDSGEVVFTLCFDVIGFGGISPITVSNFLNDIESETLGVFNGVNPRNCAVEVESPGGVVVRFPDNLGFRSTEDRCFDITVDGFEMVTDFSLNVGVSPALLDFQSFTSTIPGVTAMPFAGLGSLITIDYDGDELNLPNGTVLGNICFRALEDAEIGACDSVRLAVFTPQEVITTESGGISVEVEDVPGETCVLFPNGFGMNIADTETFLDTTFCVPVSVNNFQDIETAEILFRFDPTRAMFTGINGLPTLNWDGLDVSDFDLSQVDIGIITLSFNSNGPGVSFAGGDGEAPVFDFCFRALNREGCFTLSGEGNFDPPTRTSEGDGSIVFNNGEICIEDRLIVTSITTSPATCSDSPDGIIFYETEPREGNEPVFIRIDDPVMIGNNGSIGNLPPGTYTFILFTPGGGVQTRDSATITFDPANAAFAEVDDVVFSCSGPQVSGINSRNNIGETFRLFLLNSDGTSIFQRDGIVNNGVATTFVNEVSRYILEVTSATGCTARDTFEAFSSDILEAEAGPNTSITCLTESVTLTGSDYDEDLNANYLWQRVSNTGEVLEDVSDDQAFETSVPGRYRLTVTIPSQQCTLVDSTNVFDDVFFPPSELPTQVELSCDGTTATLSTGPFDPSISYTWFDIETGVPVPEVANEYVVDSPGEYVVELFNPANGCFRLDTVNVVLSMGVPLVIPPEFLTVPCAGDPLQIRPLYNNVDDNTDFRWTTMDGAFVPGDQVRAEPRVTSAGTYEVIVTNGACADTSQVIVGEPLLPQNVEAGEEQRLGCGTSVTLEGSGTSADGSLISFQWTTDSGPVMNGDARTVTVSTPGLYLLTVTIDATGCTGQDSVMILPPNGFPTYELADTVRGLGCEPSTVSLLVENPGSDDYTYVWNDPNGNEAGRTNPIDASLPGLYTVTITDVETGCPAMDQVLVEDDAADRPLVAFSQTGVVITCESSSIDIDATNSSAGPGITYTWENIAGGEDVSDETSTMISVSTPGTYRLTVRNEETNCSNSSDIVIGEDRDLPNVVEFEPVPLDCDLRTTTAAISIVDQPNDFTIQWSSPFMIDFPPNVTEIEVTRGGTYQALVSNLETSCVTIATIRVPDLRDSIADILFAMPDSFDCNNSLVTIDASETELRNAATDVVRWSGAAGPVVPAEGSLIVTVSEPGDYFLTIENEAGCSTTDTIAIGTAAGDPEANAGNDLNISCGDMPQLDGSASSPAPGGNIAYQWQADEGGEIISGGDGTMPFVSGLGRYTLIVTNILSGCADTATVSVTIDAEEAAVLPADFSLCSSDTTISANLPEGTSGVWTSFDDEGATVTFTDTEANVTEIGDGISLVWTLSQPGCPDYSADTVRISPVRSPAPTTDVIELVGDQNTRTIDLLANDDISGAVTVTILNDPEFGEILANDNGTVTVEVPLGLTQTTTVDYEVCSVTCPDLCATSTLTIIANANGTDPQVYNAITPNGDGRNDVLVFELLVQQGDEFPNREFIVFNRWADVVFEATPYDNNWGGTNNAGDPLPEGTYYYILRLDIGEGEIIRGDVTIIR